MSKSNTSNEVRTKKRNRRASIIALILVLIAFPVIWFGLEWLATESVISKSPVTVNGKLRILEFSEKTRGYRNKDNNNMPERGTSHYGYSLELIDSVSKKSLDKFKFSSPYHNIETKPRIIVDSTATVWVVSTTRRYDTNNMGYIYKFTLNNDKITQSEFSLTDDYFVREIDGSKIILSKGSDFYHSYTKVLGGTYYDLNTGKIVVEPGLIK